MLKLAVGTTMVGLAHASVTYTGGYAENVNRTDRAEAAAVFAEGQDQAQAQAGTDISLTVDMFKDMQDIRLMVEKNPEAGRHWSGLFRREADLLLRQAGTYRRPALLAAAKASRKAKGRRGGNIMSRKGTLDSVV